MRIGGGWAAALAAVAAVAARTTSLAAAETRSGDPYRGAVAIDAASGTVLFEDNADAAGYPASMLKIMDLLIILEKVKQGAVRLEDTVTITKEASSMGGSQVYLDPRERFTVEQLLYALMVQSANDAAVALAIHVAGTKEGFVGLMNERARQLGMSSTTFHSVHGLPPGEGQEADMTTPRDFAVLCRELVLKHPEALAYTSTRERTFRENPPFVMRTHNHLLGEYEGCDGLKTGYFRAAGYSIAATASRGDRRVIAVVLGSVSRETRDAKAKELLAKGFLAAASVPKL